MESGTRFSAHFRWIKRLIEDSHRVLPKLSSFDGVTTLFAQTV